MSNIILLFILKRNKMNTFKKNIDSMEKIFRLNLITVVLDISPLT